MPPLEFPPAPKCPQHRIFMQYQYGDYPYRFFLCPECNDHWRECGTSLRQIIVRPAFTR
jgi:hypothetical protein